MKRNIHKYIILTISILIFWILITPVLFSKIALIICENLSYNTTYEVKADTPKLYLNIIPNAVIKVKSLSLSSKDSVNNFYAENLNLKIRILPLLSGRVHIDYINADSLNVNTVFDSGVALDKNFLSVIKNTKVICDSANIKNLHISSKISDRSQRFDYVADNLSYRNSGRYLKLNLNSKININDTISTQDINIYLSKDNDINKSIMNIKIAGLDISPIADYLKNYLPGDLTSAKGIIDADIDKQHLSAVFRNIEINRKDEAKSIIFPKELRVNSDLNLTRKFININNAEIKSENTDTIISGTISNYLDRPIPEYNLDIRLNKSKIEDYINMLPAFKTEDIDSYKLKKYKFYGDIIGNFSVKGDSLEPSITGHVFVNNGILTKPIPHASGASVKLDFKGKYLNFDVVVPAGYNEKVNVRGGVELYNVKYSDMRVWSTQNVDLATAEEKVVPIHEILNFVIGPVPLMDIKGIGNIDIIIKGNRKNPHVWGALNFKNVTTHFLDIPDLILDKADAKLVFDDENVVFNLQKGFIDDKEVKIDGTSNVFGKFNFDITANGQQLEYLYKSIKTSVMIDEIKNMIPPFKLVTGLVNLKMKVYGNIKDINYTKFNENFFTKGSLELLGNSFELQDILATKAMGIINFDNTNIQMDVSSFIGNSPMSILAIINSNNADVTLNIPKLNLRDIVPKHDKFAQEASNIFVNLRAKYKGRTDIIEYEKAEFEAKITDVAKTNKLKLSNGTISYKNGTLQIKDIKGSFENTNSMFAMNIKADNLFTNPVLNGNLWLKDFELYLINSLGEYVVIPQKIRSIINMVEFKKGKINLNARISGNNINTSTNIGGIEFVYKPLGMPVKVINGSVYMRKNYLGLNKINMLAEEMPVLLDGGINNLFGKQDFNIYINSKPKQEFVDKYINNNRIYPLKLKGDIVYSAKIKGTADNFNVETEANLAKDSSIYYLGAIVGDLENSIIMNLNMDVVKQKILKIKDFSYDKLINSQGKRQTRLNMLKASGGMDILQDGFVFRDLRVKTSHPTDLRILNILFRKPNIKQGQFTSDLRFNGTLSNPRLIGTFQIKETNIPFFDTTMKNLSFNFKDKTIELYSKGEVLGNDIVFKGTLKNKLTFPYYVENAELYTKDIDVNYIANELKAAQANDSSPLDSFGSFDVKNTVIKNLKINADRVRLRNVIATNVEAFLSLNQKKVFNIDKVKFNVANGSIDGKFSYNFSNDNTWIHLNAKNINANDVTIALFNLDNQLYGNLNGNVKLSCNGVDFNRCMSTLNGSIVFDVKDGKMPKLGSLEYLLKAGNLVKGGLTGLSINNVIDVLIPLKTGNFSEIFGKMSIKQGVTNDIEIASKGNDLSLFITGGYNFATSEAEMEVLGILSKNISTVLGPIGNVSLNTLFNVVPGIDLAKDSKLLDKINKIPGIELNSKVFRKFIAEINGNINGENYVKSFRWIN